MKRLLLSTVLLLALGGCFGEQMASIPAPHEPGPTAIGYICHMALDEHRGPKGQIFIKGVPDKPLWLSSVRQVFDYMAMDGENKAVSAIYVNDMGRSKAWDRPDRGAWVEARQAVYVLGSRKQAEMGGGAELVPFSDRAAAQSFADQNGGRVVAWQEVSAALVADQAPAEHSAVRHAH